MEEIEVKFVEVDVEDVQKKLLEMGAVKKYDRLFKDRVFDFPGWPLDKENSWLRLRDKGDGIKLSFKKRFGTSEAGDAGMEEVEIAVDSFEQTTQLLEKIGMEQKFNEEKRRIHYVLGDIEVDIDYWPLIPPYIEIESDSWQKVEKMAAALGMDWQKRKMCAAMQVFTMYGINEKDYKILTFEKQEKRNG